MTKPKDKTRGRRSRPLTADPAADRGAAVDAALKAAFDAKAAEPVPPETLDLVNVLQKRFPPESES